MKTDERDLFAGVEARWQALVMRNDDADGAFYYAVVTTGIYCRPNCSSPIPRRKNVRFFDTWQSAEEAGFIPCKRCRPKDDGKQSGYQQTFIQSCRTIDESDVPPSLGELANAAGLSPFYFHRLFKQYVGVTPKQYFIEKRLKRLRANLQQSATITDAIYDAGFSSSSQFYGQAAASLGMKPSAYQQGGHGMQIIYALVECYLGWVLVAATEMGICAIDFGDQPDSLINDFRARFPGAELIADDVDFSDWVSDVVAFLESPQNGLDLPLDIQGTAFQRRVWKALQQIPCGSTLSYSQVADRIGDPQSVRAVARACASNKIAVAIPCHRVVRSDGDLAGYRWGVERKRMLLEREKSTISCAHTE